MEKVTVDREVKLDEEDVHEKIQDIERFMQAAGFDEVNKEDNTIEVGKQVGPKKIELTLEVMDKPGTVLAYRQTEGIFKHMETAYETEPLSRGTGVEARTNFELDTAVIGSFLDATVIKIQRKRELNAQLDYLES